MASSSPRGSAHASQHTSARPYLVSSSAPNESTRHNVLELWHLLSLDAPTVAAVWTWFLAQVNHVAIPRTAVIAMAVAVWLLYAADRLLDARSTLELEARHRFHDRHKSAFFVGIAVASVLLACLLPTLHAVAMRLYLIEGGILVGYFVLIHAMGSSHRLPKELAVGLFFAAAVFIPTVSHAPSLRLPLVVPALLFAMLCSLNCVFIYAWEHEEKEHARPHPATQFSVHYARPIAFLLTFTALGPSLFDPHVPWPIGVAVSISTAFLLLLDFQRHRFRPTTLRAAADFALLSPLLLCFFA